jgi:hypothetical protein
MKRFCSARGASGVEYAIVAAVVLLALALGAWIVGIAWECAFKAAATCIAGGSCSLKQCAAGGGDGGGVPGVPAPSPTTGTPDPAVVPPGRGGGEAGPEPPPSGDADKCGDFRYAVSCRTDSRGTTSAAGYVRSTDEGVELGVATVQQGDVTINVVSAEVKTYGVGPIPQWIPYQVEARALQVQYEKDFTLNGQKIETEAQLSLMKGELNLPKLDLSDPKNLSLKTRAGFSAIEGELEAGTSNKDRADDVGVKFTGAAGTLGAGQELFLSDKDGDGIPEINVGLSVGVGLGLGVTVRAEPVALIPPPVRIVAPYAARAGRGIARRVFGR